MTTVAIDVEVVSQLPAGTVFKAFAGLDKIAPKVLPQYFKSVETLEGEGGPGTVKLFTFGDAVPFTTGKYKIESVDVSNCSYSYSVIEGDILMGILDSISHHVKVVPSADGGSVYKHSVVYNCKGSEKPSEEILKKEKEVYIDSFKPSRLMLLLTLELINDLSHHINVSRFVFGNKGLGSICFVDVVSCMSLIS